MLVRSRQCYWAQCPNHLDCIHADKEECDFAYECHKCKALIPGHYATLEADQVVMVKDAKPNTWNFECESCNEAGDKDIQ